jgi:hypothetical protein
MIPLARRLTGGLMVSLAIGSAPQNASEGVADAVRALRDGRSLPRGEELAPLVSSLRAQDPAAFAQRIQDRYADYARLIADPARFRGEPVRILGSFRTSEAEGIEAPASGLWRGWLVDPSGKAGFVFDSVEPRPGGLEVNDLTEVEGLLCVARRRREARALHSRAHSARASPRRPPAPKAVLGVYASASDAAAARRVHRGSRVPDPETPAAGTVIAVTEAGCGRTSRDP